MTQRVCFACGGYFTPRPDEPLVCRTCLLLEHFHSDPASTSASKSADREVSPKSTVACGDHSTSTEAVVGSGTEPWANKDFSDVPEWTAEVRRAGTAPGKDHWMQAAEQFVDSEFVYSNTRSQLTASFLAGAEYAIKRCKESVGQLFDP